MDVRQKKDDHQAGASSDAAGPVINTGSLADPDLSENGFVCQFPGCGRTFSTKIGRGVHHQRGHKDWYDARQDVEHTKARWNAEESALLARQEARLVLQGSRYLNQDLLPFFPDRTLESIKGQRRKAQHKALVEKLVREMRSESDEDDQLEPEIAGSVPLSDTPDSERDRFRTAIAEFVEALPDCKTENFNINRLNIICRSLRYWSLDRVLEEISLYLLETFPIKASQEKYSPKSEKRSPLSRRKARRAEYARTQNLWKKNRIGCLRYLLKDKRTSLTPPKDVMIPFWERVMTTANDVTPGVESKHATVEDLWTPISAKEIYAAFPSMGTAPGPDGLSAKTLRAIPLGILVRIFNTFMLCGKLPNHLLTSRTTLIPKKDDAADPGEFRPITVSSIFARTFHKVLANRMSRMIKLDSRQKAFRPIDGCSENIFLMDFALRYCRQNFKPLFMASLDVAKAFDSVTHQTIIDTLRSAGVPSLMTEYIADTYGRSVTRLHCENWESEVIHPTCGVKQGDPLSPMIFNLVIDRLFSKLPTEVGLRLGDISLNAIGFADDLVLFATTPKGLQTLLDITANYLQECGLCVNASKCFTVALRNVPKEKKSVVDARRTFCCLGQNILALKRSEEWKYLGVPFSPEGRLVGHPLEQLKRLLGALTAAPLKPQQRLFALRAVVLPGFYHQLVLGSTNIGLLNKMDVAVRSSIRRWMALPHDVPNAYFHADAKDGGLSFPSFRWIIPLQRFHRLKKLKGTEDMEMPEIMKQFVQLEIKRAEERLRDQGRTINTMTLYKRRFADLLYNSNDGRPLEKSRGVNGQHRWVVDGDLFVSGRDFVNMNKLRINAIPLKARMARGQPREKHCRAGCRDAETLHHVLQICHRTHAARIKRHDACIDYLTQNLSPECAITREPKYQTPAGLLKPDVLVVRGTSAIVVDAQIVGERAALNRAHQAKIDKYMSLKDTIQRECAAQQVIFTSLTLSSRGVWSRQSFEHLVELKLLKLKDAKILSTRVLVGGLHAVGVFNRSTARGSGK